MSSLLFALLTATVRRFPEITAGWHDAPVVHMPADELSAAALRLHAANFSLWHCEDQVRRTDIPDVQVVRYKRMIDRLNVQRNRFIEALDHELWCCLPSADSAEFCSDTPAMITDRLSILSLRRFHTARRLPVERIDAEQPSPMRVLELQQSDLLQALDGLLEHLLAGRRRFRVYQQFKGLAPERCPASADVEALVTRLCPSAGS